MKPTPGTASASRGPVEAEPAPAVSMATARRRAGSGSSHPPAVHAGYCSPATASLAPGCGRGTTAPSMPRAATKWRQRPAWERGRPWLDGAGSGGSNTPRGIRLGTREARAGLAWPAGCVNVSRVGPWGCSQWETSQRQVLFGCCVKHWGCSAGVGLQKGQREWCWGCVQRSGCLSSSSGEGFSAPRIPVQAVKLVWTSWVCGVIKDLGTPRSWGWQGRRAGKLGADQIFLVQQLFLWVGELKGVEVALVTAVKGQGKAESTEPSSAGILGDVTSGNSLGIFSAALCFCHPSTLNKLLSTSSGLHTDT